MNNTIEQLVFMVESERIKTIEEVNQKAERAKAWLEKIAKLKADKYPDFRIEYSRDRSVKYLCSNVINSRPDAKYSTRSGCGCHRSDYGDRIELSLYIEDDGERIYSSPRTIDIGYEGSLCDMKGSRHVEINENLAELLRSYNISEDLITRICVELEEDSVTNCDDCKDEK